MYTVGAEETVGRGLGLVALVAFVALYAGLGLGLVTLVAYVGTPVGVPLGTVVGTAVDGATGAFVETGVGAAVGAADARGLPRRPELVQKWRAREKLRAPASEISISALVSPP